MAIKYFCDWCEKEVQTSISLVKLTLIDDDVDKRMGDICSNCRFRVEALAKQIKIENK